MKIVQEISLISVGSFEESSDWSIIRTEIREAISLIVHPPDTSSFTINPTKHGNGVTPIKKACMIALKDRFGWRLEAPVQFTGVFTTKEKVFLSKVDAARTTDDLPFALEWETGNISSSHRALNKMVLGFLTQTLAGGILILPSRKLYHYLTDRVGNYDELFPYFDVWRAVPLEKGFIAIFVIEHDQYDVPHKLNKARRETRCTIVREITEQQRIMQRKQYSTEFKTKAALEAIKGLKTVNEIASELVVHPSQIALWKKQALDALPAAFSSRHGQNQKAQEDLTAQLYQQIGQLKVELDWLKKKSGFVGGR